MLIRAFSAAVLLSVIPAGGTHGPAVHGYAMPPGAAAQLITDLRDGREMTRGDDVTVALLSSAVDPDVSGLSGKVTMGPDYVNLPGPARDVGTALAEGIAGDGPSPGNPLNRLGIAPGARILAIRVEADGNENGAQEFNDSAPFADLLARGIRYAVDHRAGVVYIDRVPGGPDSAALESAVSYALSRNVIVACLAVSTAEGFAGRPGFPAGLPGVIAAGLVTLSGFPAPYELVSGDTAVNNTVQIAVPDNTLEELGPGDVRERQDGYVAGGAWLAGTLALIKSAYSFLTPAQVEQALALSARYHPPGGYSTTVGFGLIDPYDALTEAGLLALQPKPPATAGLPPSAHFGTGPAPGPVVAAPRQTARVDVFGALTAFGATLLYAAYLLTRRRRPAR